MTGLGNATSADSCRTSFDDWGIMQRPVDVMEYFCRCKEAVRHFYLWAWEFCFFMLFASIIHWLESKGRQGLRCIWRQLRSIQTKISRITLAPMTVQHLGWLGATNGKLDPFACPGQFEESLRYVLVYLPLVLRIAIS